MGEGIWFGNFWDIYEAWIELQELCIIFWLSWRTTINLSFENSSTIYTLILNHQYVWEIWTLRGFFRLKIAWSFITIWLICNSHHSTIWLTMSNLTVSRSSDWFLTSIGILHRSFSIWTHHIIVFCCFWIERMISTFFEFRLLAILSRLSFPELFCLIWLCLRVCHIVEMFSN